MAYTKFLYTFHRLLFMSIVDMILFRILSKVTGFALLTILLYNFVALKKMSKN